MTLKSFILNAVVATIVFVILSPLLLYWSAIDRTGEKN